MLPQLGVERRLPRGRLSKPCGEHAAHRDPLDRLASDARARDRRAHRRRAEIGGRGAGKASLKAAHRGAGVRQDDDRIGGHRWRSEEHTSELLSLMRISYAVFCLTKKTFPDHQYDLKYYCTV